MTQAHEHSPTHLLQRIDCAASLVRAGGPHLDALDTAFEDMRLAGFPQLADALQVFTTEARRWGQDTITELDEEKEILKETIAELEAEVARLEKERAA